MDLKKEIMDFLQTKKDWDLIAKTYYIYIKLCKIFSYDYRYLFGTEEEKKKFIIRKWMKIIYKNGKLFAYLGVN